MKTSVVAIIALLFISNIKAENFLSSTQVEEDIGKKLQDQVNAKIKSDYTADKLEIDNFLASVQSAFDTHLQNGMVDKMVGHNKISYTQNCDYEYNPIEVPVPPTEKECVQASYDAQFFVEAIAKISKYNISDTTTVLKNLGNCEIMGKKDVYVNLDVYGDCLQGEFKQYYDQYFVQVKSDMEAKGFTWNEKLGRFEHSQQTGEIQTGVMGRIEDADYGKK